MQIYKCDRCGLIVQDYHDMAKVGWQPYVRSTFEEAFDMEGSQRYGVREVCSQCLGLFKVWLGVEDNPEDIEPFEAE